MTEIRKRLYGIRGASCAENTSESIIKSVKEMCSSLFLQNNLSADDIVSIHFTLTDDLTVLNPAAALRKSDCGTDVSSCALFCSQEAKIDGGMKHVIRVLVTAYMRESEKPHHIYINGAEKLRPDFSKGIN